MSEVFRGRLIGVVDRDRVGQLSARRDRARQHVRERVAALHPALPRIQYRRQLAAVLLRPRHVDNVAAVHHDDRLCKSGGHIVQHLRFRLGQIVAALGQRVLSVLAGGSAYDHDCDVIARSTLCGERRGHLHLGIVHRPMTPKAVERLVLWLCAPFAVGRRQCAVEFQRAPLLGGLERVEIAYLVRRLDVSAAAVTDIERVDLAPAEQRDPVCRTKGQDTVVAKKHHALRRRPARKFRHPGQVILASARRVALLRYAVVLDRFCDLHAEFEHPSHHKSSPFADDGSFDYDTILARSTANIIAHLFLN